ncbi:MAG TPA: hypothetical protein VE010_00230 [Thermoanaerobaculia bacterium]|nr:hypothetical protein [Thermoanaerobaculia bacterium]
MPDSVLSGGAMQGAGTGTTPRAVSMSSGLRPARPTNANGVQVTPLLPANFQALGRLTGRQSDVINLVVHQLPQPTEDSSLEHILRFRQDEDARRSLRRLRAWIAKAIHDAAPISDLQTELQLFIDRYAEYMRIHRLKSEVGTLETFFTTTADVVGNIAKLNLGAAVKALFEVRARRIALMEAELQAPGREAAFIVEA